MLPTLISIILIAATPNYSVLGSEAVPQNILATHTMPMNDRYGVESVNTVFKKNILLNLAYLDGKITSKAQIDWDSVLSDSHYEFTLKPGEEFAFHSKIGKQYDNGQIVKTTNAHFNYDDGFISDGYLTGDGVCHFASLIDWVATDAGLQVVAPTNHNFAKIPDIPAKYGVGIYMGPDAGENNNLYVTNTKEKAVTFVFDYQNDNLVVSIKD